MRLLERIISVYAPFSCLICGIEGAPVCEGCWLDVYETPPSACYRCNRLSVDYRVCTSCRQHSPLDHVWLASEYQSTAKELIKGLKYQHRRAYAGVLARMLDESLPLLAEPPLVCPVPTTTKRRRMRGYDHAALIARQLAGLRGWPYVNPLVRLDQSHQVGANRRERLANPIQYRVGNVRDKSILLIDDVVTTGRSIETAAKALHKAGAIKISAVVVAGNKIR